MALTDFHCHLAAAGGYGAVQSQDSLFEPDQTTTRLVAVTNRPSEWAALHRGSHPGQVTWALGLHPALSHPAVAVDDLLKLLPSADALGEVGLDYSREAVQSRAEQRAALDRILEAESARRLLVTLHSRGATGDVVAALGEHRLARPILHWFLGSDKDIDRAIDAHAFFSVNEAMLASERGKRVTLGLPPNRVLLETDAPYGGHRRKIAAGDLGPAVKRLAALWVLDEAATIDLVTRNEQSLLGRAEPPGP